MNNTDYRINAQTHMQITHPKGQQCNRLHIVPKTYNFHGNSSSIPATLLNQRTKTADTAFWWKSKNVHNNIKIIKTISQKLEKFFNKHLQSADVAKEILASQHLCTVNILK